MSFPYPTSTSPSIGGSPSPYSSHSQPGAPASSSFASSYGGASTSAYTTSTSSDVTSFYQCEWYYVHAQTGVTTGPLNFLQLKQEYMSGSASDQSLCWNETLDGWIKIGQFPALQMALMGSAAVEGIESIEQLNVNKVSIKSSPSAASTAAAQYNSAAPRPNPLPDRSARATEEKRIQLAREMAILRREEEGSSAAERARKLEADRLERLKKASLREAEAAKRAEEESLVNRVKTRQVQAVIQSSVKKAALPPAATLPQPDKKRAADPTLSAAENDPAAWVEFSTPEGIPYYFNKVSQQSVWQKPGCLRQRDEQIAGDWYWLAHPEHAYIPCKKVQTLLDGRMEFESEDGKRQLVPKLSVLQRVDWAALKRPVKDLVHLDQADEPTVLHHLRQRFGKHDIYCSIGPHLLALNPYQLLPLYTPAVIDQYRHHARDMPPHVFGIADRAYSSLIEQSKSQIIYISGESGSGKSEVTKQCLQYLAEVAGSANNVETRILLSIPILEAFGHARTIKNNNSSRFGKVLEIFFDSQASICGAAVNKFLLEKSRVVHVSEGERNYHIFYFLSCGLDDSQRRLYQIQDPIQYNLLNQGQTLLIEGISDADEFAEVQSAMDALGFEPLEKQSAFQILSAILHLGNIKFRSLGDRQCSVAPDSKEALFHAARLLEVKESALLKSITVRVLFAPNSPPIDIALSVSEALSARDNLAKFLYSKLFDWVCTRINQAIGVGEARRGRSIAILDVFGFESSPVNSLDTLMINYANERLHQLILQHTIKQEQRVYESEEILYSPVNFTDNQNVIDIVDLSPNGLIWLIEEEIRVPKSTDATLMEKIAILNSNQKEFGKILARPDQFLIRHYAGEVCYEVNQWLAKSKDRINEDLLDLLLSTSNVLIRHLFGASSEEDAATRKLTLGVKFKGQVDQLLQSLEANEAHYIRCLRPNKRKSPTEFQAPLVLQQLQAHGLFDLISVRKRGFPFRLTHLEFFKRYKCILAADQQEWPNAKIACEQILETLDFDRRIIQLGLTKVLYRVTEHNVLEMRRNAAIESRVLKLQKCVRGWIARKTKRLLLYVKPFLLKAMLLKDVAAVDKALAAVGSLPFPLFEWEELKRRRVFLAEEDRLISEMKELALGDAEAKFERISQVTAHAEEIGLQGEWTERMKLRLVEVQEKRKARAIIREGIDTLDEFKLEEGLQLAVKWLLHQKEADVLEEAAAAKERIVNEKQFMVALQKALAVGGFVNDGDAIEWAHLDALILQAHDFGFRMSEGIKLLKLASIISELRKRLAMALGSKDRALWRAIEPIAISAASVPGGAEHPEVIRARNELALQVAVEEICERIARAVESLNPEAIEFSLLQAQQVGLDERKYPVIPIAREYLVRIREGQKFLTDAILAVNIQLLNEAIYFCELFGFESEQLNQARQLRDTALQLEVDSEFALQRLDEDLMRQCLMRANLIAFTNPTVERIRELLERTSPEKFMQLQLKAALATQDRGRAIATMIKLKDQFFRKSQGLFVIENFPRLKKSDAWAREKLICLDRPALAASMRQYTRDPIHSSLIELGELGDAALRRVKFACQLFKNILGFCGDRPYGGQFVLVTELLNACLAHRWLRDELFLQLLKQLTNNPNKESESRCWQLLLICMETFPPNPEFENYLENFIRERAPNDRKQLFLRTLHGTVYGGERQVCPSEAEMKTIISGQNQRNARFDEQKLQPPPRAMIPQRAPLQGIGGTTPQTIVQLIKQSTGQAQAQTQFEAAQEAAREAERKRAEEEAKIAAQRALEDRRTELMTMRRGQEKLSSHQREYQERVERDSRVAQQQAQQREYISKSAHQLVMNQSMLNQHVNRPIEAAIQTNRMAQSMQTQQLAQQQQMREQEINAALKPLNWQLVHHPENGHIYYFNSTTNEAVWVLPPKVQNILKEKGFQL